MRIIALCVALLIPVSAWAWVHGSAGVIAYNGIFQGNPNPSIASITPSITCSRSGSIQTPAFIQCSASPTTASGTSLPYEDLEYTWNFGDPSGTETFTHPISGNTVNANSKQWGPEAAYVYRNAGTYTITLNIRGCTNGPTIGVGLGTCSGGTYTSSSTTTSITVTSFSATNEFYFSASSGSDSNACSSSLPCQTMSKLSSLMTSNPSGSRFHLNCGATEGAFTSANGIAFSGTTNYNGIRVEADGSACPGTCPTINISSGTNNGISIPAANSATITKQDIVFSGICFTDSGSATPSLALIEFTGAGGSNNTRTNIYFDNVNVNLGLDTAISNIDIEPNTGEVLTNVGFWNPTITAPLSGVNTCTGILGFVDQWWFIVGGNISGSGAGKTNLCHHIYTHINFHLLARWITFGNSDPTGTAPTRDYSIKTAYEDAEDSTNPGNNFYGQYYLTSENYYKGTKYGRNYNNASASPTTTRITFTVDEQNVYYQLQGGGNGSGGTGIIQPTTAEHLTLRDNWVCNPQDEWYTPNGVGQNVYSQAQVYRNKYYQGTTPSSGTDGDGAFVFGLATAITWGGGSPLPQVFTDNMFEDAGSSSVLVAYIKSTDWVTAGSKIDRNGYYVPNFGSNYLSNNGTGVSFATWQGLGWDTNGSAGSNPGWPSPATCGFGSWPFN